MNDELHKYHCTIRPGLAVNCTLNINDFRNGKPYMIVIWDGSPKPKDIPKYKEWMFEIYRNAADSLGENMLWALLPGGGLDGEIWKFEPGKQPQCVERIPHD